MTTFKDVEKKYQRAVEYMEFNEKSFLTQENNLPTWIHLHTLARWFYGSSQEFYSDYIRTSNNYSNEFTSLSRLVPREEITKMYNWETTLITRLKQFKNELAAKFPDDKLLAEILK